MEYTARQSYKNILITQVDSLLGAHLAKFFLSPSSSVYGVAKHPPSEEVLKDPNFTLLDIDIAQPFPAHLPQFDLIVHLLPETSQTLKDFSSSTSFTPATNNILSQAINLSKVILMAPLIVSDFFYDNLAKDQRIWEHLQLFLVGDVYGPQNLAGKTHHAQHFYAHNELNNLISQAIYFDKIILEDEGLKVIVPTYIDDALSAFAQFTDAPNPKKVRIIVSQGPKTALSTAYEIQKIAQLALNKQLKLFFSGPARKVTPEPQPIIRLEHLGFEPKINLEEGLKRIFESHRQSPTPTHSLAQPPVEVRYPDSQNPVKKHLTLPIPRAKIGLNTKRIVLLALLFLMLTFLKTGLDIYIGMTRLKEAQAALTSGDLEKVKSKAQSAEKSFGAARTKYQLLSLPLRPLLPGKVNSISYILTSAQLGASSLQFFIEGAKGLIQDLKIITSTQTQQGSVDTEAASANFKKSYLASTQAYELARSASEGKIFAGKISQAKEGFQALSTVSSTSLEFINFIKDLTGTSDKKTYLILLQNNAELRPGGGFIGSYGEISFENGHLANLNVQDIYAIDGQLKEKIEAPKELTDKLGVKQLYLRDSNWSPDFVAGSATVRDFYKKETGREVNGVIAIDLTFIQNLLEKIGPVKLEDYNEEISAQNLFERGEYHSEVGFTPGSTQKKDFFSSLTHTLIDKIIQGLQSAGTKDTKSPPFPWLEIINTTRLALSGKHMLLSFDDKNLSSLVKTKGWDNPLPPIFFDPGDDSLETRDFLALSEANLGANKANRFIERKVDYEMTIGRDADLVAKLKITYKNNAKADTWPAGTYVNFLRVYAPAAAGLLSYQNGSSTDLKAVKVSNQANLTVFSTFIEVPVKETREVTFTYRIPKNIKLEQAPTYHFYISKQPGTENDPLMFTFNLPQYIEIKSVNQDQQYSGKQNYKVETDLSTDRSFQIEVKKK